MMRSVYLVVGGRQKDVSRLLKVFVEELNFSDFEEACRIVEPITERLKY